MILTMRNEPAARQARFCGVAGYVLEAADTEAGLSRSAGARPTRDTLSPAFPTSTLADKDKAEGRTGRTLSDREVEVMRLIAAPATPTRRSPTGFSASARWESHRPAIQKKLDIGSRAELVRYAHWIGVDVRNALDGSRHRPRKDGWEGLRR